MRAAVAQFRTKRAVAAPAEATTAVNALGWDAQQFGPNGYRVLLAVYLYYYVIRTVALLFPLGRPADIPGLVMAVYVDSIQGVLGAGPTTDGGQKLLERGKAKLDATSAVQGVRPIRLICAAVFGRAKRPHFGRRAAALKLMVGTQSRRRGFTVQAPTRLRVALNQGGCCNGFYGSPA